MYRKIFSEVAPPPPPQVFQMGGGGRPLHFAEPDIKHLHLHRKKFFAFIAEVKGDVDISHTLTHYACSYTVHTHEHRHFHT